MNRRTLATMAKTEPPEPLLEHAIRLRAYDLYEQRGCRGDHSVDDWLRAEANVLGDIFWQGASQEPPLLSSQGRGTSPEEEIEITTVPRVRQAEK